MTAETVAPVTFEGIDLEGEVPCDNKCGRRAEWVITCICPSCGPNHALGCDPCRNREAAIAAASWSLTCIHCRVVSPTSAVKLSYRRFG